MAAALGVMVRKTLRSEFRRIDPLSARIVLVDMGNRVLGTFAEDLSEAAKKHLEELGVAFAVVMELVRPEVARKITAAITIPTIGIGSGPDCDGQVLVVHDLIGLFPWFTPKFATPRAQVSGSIREAVQTFVQDTKVAGGLTMEHNILTQPPGGNPTQVSPSEPNPAILQKPHSSLPADATAARAASAASFLRSTRTYSTKLHDQSVDFKKASMPAQGSLERKNNQSLCCGNLNSVQGQIEPEAPGC